METTYIQAISEALAEEMEADPSVFLIGEDIGTYGGAFKVTKGLLERFGPRRVVDTPIAEAGIAGVAAGTAMMGLRPVVEMQFSDFVACAFNQIVNNMAQTHYRWGTSIPVVIRCPSGGFVHGGPFHSQNPESWFFGCPGLKIVAPSTPWDAKGLLKAAIRDPNPVLYFEHKYLYRRIKSGPVPPEHVVDLGSGSIIRGGEDMTLITYGATVHTALEAANTLADEGASIEVLDLRTLKPFDGELILDSVRRTSRALIVHEDRLTGGIGGEIAAFIAETAFESLDAPVRRLAGEDTPIPYSPPLEDRIQVTRDKIVEAMRNLLEY